MSAWERGVGEWFHQPTTLEWFRNRLPGRVSERVPREVPEPCQTASESHSMRTNGTLAVAFREMGEGIARNAFAVPFHGRVSETVPATVPEWVAVGCHGTAMKKVLAWCRAE